MPLWECQAAFPVPGKEEPALKTLYFQALKRAAATPDAMAE